MKRLIVVGMAVLFTVGLAACSSDSSTSSAGGSPSGSDASMGTPVSATEKDFAITLDPTSVPSGEVTFNIMNEGPSVHEFVVVSTDVAPDALPVEDGVVTEDALDAIGEQEDIAPDTSTDLSLMLDPGSYVVICNLPGHYEQGMYVGLTVT